MKSRGWTRLVLESTWAGVTGWPWWGTCSPFSPPSSSCSPPAALRDAAVVTENKPKGVSQSNCDTYYVCLKY